MEDNPKLSFLKSCRRIREDTPEVFMPEPRETFRDKKNNIVRYEIGERSVTASEKVVLLVGATGCGKSTLMNMLFNYAVGVRWEDSFRFQLQDEQWNQSKNLAKSVTSWITVYTIHHQQWFEIPHTLTLIDTPGFGDTAGIQRDQEITAQLKTCFQTQGPNGVDRLDAVGFVAQSSLPRLTPSQRYIFDSILSLFGKDIEDNIFMLLTFADGQKPQVLSGLKAANLPYKKFFKFNNSALFVDNQEDEDFDNFDRMFWKMGEKGCKYFLTELDEVNPRSLVLTREVLLERNRLEALMKGIHMNLKLLLHKSDQLHMENEILKRNFVVDQNKTVTYETNEIRIQKVQTKPGQYTTNCISCNMTCHENCTMASDKDMSKCIVMKNDHCEVCPGNCHYTMHKNQPFVYAIEIQRVTRTFEDIRQKYARDKGNKLSADHLRQCYNEFQAVQTEITRLVEKSKKITRRLSEIALRPNILESTPDYIEILINSEKAEARPGYEQRIAQLMAIKEQAELLNSDQTEISSKYQESIAQVLAIKPSFSQIAEYNRVSESTTRDAVVFPLTAGTAVVAKTITSNNDQFKLDSAIVAKSTMGRPQLGQFVCGQCEKSYNASAIVFLFGNLSASQVKRRTTVKVKAFLCSSLSNIKQFVLDLVNTNQKYKLELLAEQSLVIRTRNLDPEESKVTMVMGADDDSDDDEDGDTSVSGGVWVPFPRDHDLWDEERKHFIQSSHPLPGVLDLNGCHNCRSQNPLEAMSVDQSPYPLDAMTVDMKTKQITSEFHGVFRLIIHGAVIGPVPESERKASDTALVRYENNMMTLPFTVRGDGSNFRLLEERRERMTMTMSPGHYSALTGMGVPDMRSAGATVQKSLSDQHLVDLSRRITDGNTFHELGATLGVRSHVLHAFQYNTAHEITMATQKMLEKWLLSKPDRVTAWSEQERALLDMEMRLHVDEVLNKTYDGR